MMFQNPKLGYALLYSQNITKIVDPFVVSVSVNLKNIIFCIKMHINANNYTMRINVINVFTYFCIIFDNNIYNLESCALDYVTIYKPNSTIVNFQQ